MLEMFRAELLNCHDLAIKFQKGLVERSPRVKLRCGQRTAENVVRQRLAKVCNVQKRKKVKSAAGLQWQLMLPSGDCFQSAMSRVQ